MLILYILKYVAFQKMLDKVYDLFEKKKYSLEAVEICLYESLMLQWVFLLAPRHVHGEQTCHGGISTITHSHYWHRCKNQQTRGSLLITDTPSSSHQHEKWSKCFDQWGSKWGVWVWSVRVWLENTNDVGDLLITKWLNSWGETVFYCSDIY